MIENIDDLTIKQKEDLQKFVNIAQENKKLWWTNKDVLKGKTKVVSLSDYFPCIDILNEILINFPIPDEDINGNIIKKVLQFISEDEIMVGYTRPSLDICESKLYCFRFKKQETLIDNDTGKLNVEDLKELDTQQLLTDLKNILNNLENEEEFSDKYWKES